MNNTEYEVIEVEQIPELPANEKKWYQDVSLDEARSIIRENITSASRSFIAVGYYLKNVRDRELYSDGGYESVWEFADAEYGISKSTTSRYMSMNDKFSLDGNSPYVAPEYKDFSRSQLQEMLYLTSEQIELVTPETQVKQIREIRQPVREIPYMDIPGQLNISDFPGVVPGTIVPEITAVDATRTEEIASGGSMTLTMADFDIPIPSVQQIPLVPQSIAISQQGEQVASQAQYVRGCITGWSKYGYCVCCGSNGVKCCTECDEPCNACCGWIPEQLPPEESQTEEPEEIVPLQPDLPLLKNNDQRAAFVDAYETWPLWIETEQTGERYYRYNLDDDTSMVVKVYHAMLFDYKSCEERWEDRFSEGWGKHEYYLLQEGKFFRDCDANRSALIEKLKEVQKKI